MKKIGYLVLGIILLWSSLANTTDWGKTWIILDKISQTSYAMGFRSGYSMGYAVGRIGGEANIEPIIPQYGDWGRILGLNPEILADTMTHLYKNPANRAIPFSYICNIAIGKIMGVDKKIIEDHLESYRQEDWDKYFTPR